jgi:serine phosphatase RsbU (regulator of sigma subunit)
LFIAVADCTGHGVPGAFMSLMGISYLSEIINENKIVETDEILNMLRTKVIFNLNKTTNTKAKSDGMDIVIIRINTATLQLQFSGANNTIYIIQNNQLQELKGNKMPVGLYTDVLKPFTKNEFQLKLGDRLFATTDGLPDQFGGPKGKKFMYKQLEQQIIGEPNLLVLKKNIIYNFEIWKGSNEQIDDITFVGIEF